MSPLEALRWGTEFAVSCYHCGDQEKIGLLAHRNENGNMVGWLFICEDCFSVVADKNLEIKIALKSKA